MNKKIHLEFLNYLLGYLFLYPLILFIAVGYQPTSSLLNILLTFLISVYIFREDIKKDFVKLIHSRWTNFVLILVVIVVIICFEMLFGSIIDSFLPATVSAPANQNSLVLSLNINPALALCGIVFLGPVNEELMFRKALFSCFKQKKLSSFFTILLSSLFFSFVHVFPQLLDGVWQEFIYLIPYTVIGIGFGIVAHKTNSIFFPILAHILYNAVTVLFFL